MGLSHRFDFDGRSVEVRLPSESAADRGEGYDTVARCVRWKRHDGKKIPLAYNISKIDVSVIVKGMIEIPEKLLQLNPTKPLPAAAVLLDILKGTSKNGPFGMMLGV